MQSKSGAVVGTFRQCDRLTREALKLLLVSKFLPALTASASNRVGRASGRRRGRLRLFATADTSTRSASLTATLTNPRVATFGVRPARLLLRSRLPAHSERVNGRSGMPRTQGVPGTARFCWTDPISAMLEPLKDFNNGLTAIEYRQPDSE